MAITVRSDFWSNNYAFQRASGSIRKRIARLLNLTQSRDDRALLTALDGVVPGSNATATLKRVQHSTQELGGKRVIETNTLINRNTAAADVTDLNTALLTYNSRPTYAVDKATRP